MFANEKPTVRYGSRDVGHLKEEGGTGPQAAQAAKANSIMATGSAGKKHYGHRQGSPIELGPEILATTRILDA